MKERRLRVGDVVVVERACMRNHPRARALVVEEYDRGDTEGGRYGVTLLFENGEFDGFSPTDVEIFGVVYVAHNPKLAAYKFVNVTRLESDYHRGVFAAAFT